MAKIFLLEKREVTEMDLKYLFNLFLLFLLYNIVLRYDACCCFGLLTNLKESQENHGDTNQEL